MRCPKCPWKKGLIDAYTLCDNCNGSGEIEEPKKEPKKEAKKPKKKLKKPKKSIVKKLKKLIKG